VATNAWANRALAEPAAVRVRVEPPLPECIAAHELERRVASFFGPIEGAPVELKVTFQPRTPAGYRADVTYRSPTGMRARSIESENSDCHDLDEPLVVVIDALASESDASNAAANEPGPEPTPTLPTKRGRAPVALVEQPSRPPPPIPRVPHVVALGLAVELGALPSPVPSVRIDGRLAFGRRWAAQLGFGTTPWASTVRYSAATVDFSVTSARLLGCVDWLPARHAHADTCAGIDGGVVTAAPTGFELDDTTMRPALWAVAEARAGTTLGVTVLEAFVAVGPALTRDSYGVTDAAGEPQTLYRTAPFRGVAGLAVGVPVP
jgi:hypothetical protein